MPIIGISGCNASLCSSLKKVLEKLSVSYETRYADEKNFFDVVLLGTYASESIPHFKTEIAIIPEGIDISFLPSPSVAISYGFGHKNTVTASAISENCITVSVQRTFPTVHGNSVGEQEFVIRKNSDTPCEQTLAETTLLLVLGISPEKLASLPMCF